MMRPWLSTLARPRAAATNLEQLLQRARHLAAAGDPRALSSDAAPTRERMHYDVCIVGAGPAGLAAAIKLKQVSAAARRGPGWLMGRLCAWLGAARGAWQRRSALQRLGSAANAGMGSTSSAGQWDSVSDGAIKASGCFKACGTGGSS